MLRKSARALTMKRRGFLKYLAEGTILLSALRLFSLFPNNGRTEIVRPPGAVEEAYFDLLCIRCGICLEVCPTKTITLMGFEDGMASVNTPKIDPQKGACEFFRGRCEETMRCSRYCPTGALQRVGKEQVKLGTVSFDPENCLAYVEKECLICYEMCPIPGAITMTEDLKPIFNENKCIGCGTCVNSCPTNPKALILISEGSKRTKWLR